MSATTAAGPVRRLGRGPVLAGILLVTFAGTALAAAANSVHATPPSHAVIKKDYSIKVSGHAAGPKTLYVFIDYLRCGATPYIEEFTHGAPGVYTSVSGDFSKPSHWKSSVAKKDHACVYLVKASEPLDPSTGVVAKAFVTYRVHRK